MFSCQAKPGRYYAVFLLDLDGNNVEAVYREFDSD
jgi:hypothetical protein